MPPLFSWQRGMLLWIMLILGVFLPASRVGATPFLPDSDSYLVEVVSNVSRTARMSRALALRADVSMPLSEGEISRRISAVRSAINAARLESEPRYLGYAETLLAGLIVEPNPLPEALLLRGTLKQSNHDFEAALRDLDRALAINPEMGQAWLTKAMVLLAQGQFEGARQSCGHLLRTSHEMIVALCVASVKSMRADSDRVFTTLSTIVARSDQAPKDELAWAHEVLGEIAGYRGLDGIAGSHFKVAYELDPQDAYRAVAYADFLLRTQENSAAIALLSAHKNNGAAKLRLALAAKNSADLDSFVHYRDDLGLMFAEAAQRNDVVHRREEAFFQLHLLGNAEIALKLATENFKIQREWGDLLILAESAIAAHDTESLNLAVAWYRENDLRISQFDSMIALASKK